MLYRCGTKRTHLRCYRTTAAPQVKQPKAQNAILPFYLPTSGSQKYCHAYLTVFFCNFAPQKELNRFLFTAFIVSHFVNPNFAL